MPVKNTVNADIFNSLTFRLAAKNKSLPDKCIKILFRSPEGIDFLTNKAAGFSIEPSFVTFFGRDLLAEILCLNYSGKGLNINDARCRDIYNEAIEAISDNELKDFCSSNRQRWKRIRV